ncbi:hypothetical protein G7054_g1143 [Neopestalotiopsis clavispora]|nr:hypothetical protein G7054_g1143 [Neopestalotiopsis clavispora]
MSSNPPYDDDSAYDEEPVIRWGPWKRLPNGQWHRKGQDASGEWYEEYSDVDPRVSEEVDPSEPRFHELEAITDDLGDLTFDPSNSNYYPSSYQGQGTGYGHYDTATAGQQFPDTSTSGNYSGTGQQEIKQSKSKGKHSSKPEPADSGYRTQDRGGKSTRSHKGDSKGHVTSSSRKRTDPKGKNRDFEQQPAIASSSRHGRSDALPTADDGFQNPPPGGKHSRSGVEGMAQQLPIAYGSTPSQGIAPFDGSSVSGFSQSLRGVSDMYSGSSSAAMPAEGHYEALEGEEEVDAVPNLPGPSNYPPQGRLRAKSGSYDEDFTRYVVERSKKFTFGTVFKCMWSEPMGNSRLSKHNKDPVNSGTSISEFGQRNIGNMTLYEGIRRFIVIDGNENGAKHGNSICVQPMLLNDEPDLGVAPIRLVVNRDLQGVERLAPESRINYSKHVTIEHNSIVHIIGQIHQDDLDTLAAGVDDNWEKRIRDRNKKDKKQERHKGSH